MDITRENLLAEMDYDEAAGKLYWKRIKGSTVKIGAEVGCFDSSTGYIKTTFYSKRTYVHRLIYILHNPPPPKGWYIDHIDHNRTNNRITNLRAVSPSDSAKNIGRKGNNTTGATGVWRRKHRWYAEIKHNKKKIFLGGFSSLAEAHAARLKAEAALGYHPNHGMVVSWQQAA